MRIAQDAVLGLVALAIAGVYYAGATQIPESLLADAVGADGIPRMLGIGMGLVGAAMVLRGLLRPAAAAAKEGDDDAVPLRHYVRAAVLLAVLVLYLVAIPYLGYPISVALLIAAVAWFAGARADATLAVTAVAGAGVFWFMFHWLLGIPMPAGLLAWT